MMNWERPQTVLEVRSFLGTAKTFEVYCDPSYQRLGCVLMQEKRPVAYASR